MNRLPIGSPIRLLVARALEWNRILPGGAKYSLQTQGRDRAEGANFCWPVTWWVA